MVEKEGSGSEVSVQSSISLQRGRERFSFRNVLLDAANGAVVLPAAILFSYMITGSVPDTSLVIYAAVTGAIGGAILGSVARTNSGS